MQIRVHKSILSQVRAFTLAEVVISVLVLNVAVAGLMGCFRYAWLVTRMAKENQRATQVMLERAEAIRLCNWSQVLSNGFIPATFTDYFDPTQTNSGVVYSGTATVAAFPYATSYSSNMRMLTLTVQWQTGSVSRSRTNVTYIAKDGIQNYVF